MITDEQCRLAYAAWFAYHTRPDAPPDHLADHEHESLTAMRVALEAAKQAAWQTIESAPQATRVLVVTASGNVSITAHPWQIAKVTHWRPLPDPPALAKERGL